MARGRMIDQGFVRSHRLRSCSRDARLLYASILPFLDREGRQVAEPATLKGTILRETDFSIPEIATLLLELEGVGLLTLYGSDDYAAILQFDRFLEFNKPNHKEAKSIFPKSGTKRAQPVRDEIILAHSTPGGSPGNAPGEPLEDARGEARGSAQTTVTGEAPGHAPDKRREELTPTTTSRKAAGRAERPPALQSYLDRVNDQPPSPLASELEKLQAKWSEREKPLPS